MAHKLTMPPGDTSTELTDSLLHTDLRRVVLGAICGIAAGLVLLVLTIILKPQGMANLWWLQMMSTSIFGGGAMAFEAPSVVLITGTIIHFTVSIFCGIVVGKMTTSQSAKRLMIYGLVFGGLCWLASNMFAPDFFDVLTLSQLGQWTRVFIFVPFGISLGLFLGLASRALKA